MNYQITQLDRRHNGHLEYKYMVSPVFRDYHESRRMLTELRNWCWATYGPGSDLGWPGTSKIWAWDTDHGNKRIYLKGDEELTMFKLRFS